MTKVILNDLANLQNETTAVATINANNAVIETAFDNTLSRDGTSPNTMGSSLDMNSNRIINLSSAVLSTEPVRKAEFDAAVFGDLVVGIPINTSNVWNMTQFFTTNGFNPAVNDDAIVTLFGAFGGGLTISDTNVLGVWSTNLGTTFNIGVNGNASGWLPANTYTFSTTGFTIPMDRGLKATSQNSGSGGGTATITNAPASGNPTFWLKVSINGTNYSIPCWAN